MLVIRRKADWKLPSSRAAFSEASKVVTASSTSLADLLAGDRAGRCRFPWEGSRSGTRKSGFEGSAFSENGVVRLAQKSRPPGRWANSRRPGPSTRAGRRTAGGRSCGLPGTLTTEPTCGVFTPPAKTGGRSASSAIRRRGRPRRRGGPTGRARPCRRSGRCLRQDLGELDGQWTLVAIGLNGPRISAGASGFMSQRSMLLGAHRG